jgi:hypothetical protein
MNKPTLVEKIDAVIKSIHLSTRTGKERQEMARAILAVVEEMREPWITSQKE